MQQAAQAQRDLLRSEETALLLAEKVIEKKERTKNGEDLSQFFHMRTQVEYAEAETGLLLRKAQEAELAIEKIKRDKAEVRCVCVC